MKTLSGSLAALAIIAMREDNLLDVARLLAQASTAPDVEEFLECQLSDCYETSCLVNTVSSMSTLSESVSALNDALQLNAEEERFESMYSGDSISQVNTDEPEDDVEFEFDEDIDDDEEPSFSSNQEQPVQQSSLIALRFD